MRAFLLSCAAFTLMVPTTTSAKPAFVGSVPNASTLSCNTCHVAGSPKSVRNDFGIDVKATLKGGMPDWSALCELDSDGDGATNGEELQDMLCEWVSGSDPGCSALVTAPGDANSVPANSFCGDGTCDEGEDVDCCAEDCDIPEPPPVDEEESDAGVADDVMEEDVPPMDDVTQRMMCLRSKRTFHLPRKMFHRLRTPMYLSLRRMWSLVMTPHRPTMPGFHPLT